MLNGYTPVFSNFGNDVFASDVALSCASCIATEISKLQPVHTRGNSLDFDDAMSVQKVLENPNEWMTTSDFLEKIIWLLLASDNAFVVSVFDEYQNAITGETRRVYRALYPVNPSLVEFLSDENNTLFIRFHFAEKNFTIRYSDVIHIRANFSSNEILGGDKNGNKNNSALLKILRINETMVEGIANAIKASYSISGIVKYNTLMSGDKKTLAVNEFIESMKSNDFKIGALDLTQEFTPLSRDINFVDKDTLEFIDKKICRVFKMCLPVLESNYTKEEYSGFYQTCLEPIITKLSQAFTKGMFSNNQRARGNKIEFYPNDLIFLNMDQTLEAIRLIGDTGGLDENEKRRFLGLRPRPELDGVRMQSLNYINVNDARQYQMKGGGDKNGKVKD